MSTVSHRHAVFAVAKAAHPLSFKDSDYDDLLADIGDARLVLIGEASHGTHEFYRERARITRRLIAEKGFCAVAVEADWPDAYRLNKFVLNESADPNANEALADFRRFPAWMWRNTDVVAFAEWLREHNSLGENCAGFYGLDLYSLHASTQAVLGYLDKVDPAAAQRARFRYGCFEHFGEDTQAYGYAASYGMTESCEAAVVEQLVDLRRHAQDIASWDGLRQRRETFSAEQNALLVRDAELYYRTMFGGRDNSWNIRDTHMADALDRLLEFLGPESKVVVWAHNSHLGDARATQMGRAGEINLGQLARQRHGPACYNIGFTTYTGEVTAANDWDEPPERTRVRPGLPGSYEELFHSTDLANFLLLMRPNPALHEALSAPLLERAIGVIYRPESERISHYFEANLAEQFDAVIHIDRTSALVPLETTATRDQVDAPDTFPSAL